MGSRYAIFSAQYLPHIGGVEKYTENLACELSLEGNTVDIVTNNTERLSIIEEDFSRGIRILRLPCIPLFDGRLPLPLFDRNAWHQMEELKENVYAGVLINARFYPHTLIGLRFAKAIGVRPIVLDHGSNYLTFTNPIIDPFVRVYERAVTRIVKKWKPCFYGVSKKSITWLDCFGISACGVLSNSIDAERFRLTASDRNFRNDLGIPKDVIIIAFTGRMIPEKGVQTILDAAQVMEGRGVKNIHFILAGKGPLESRILDSKLKNITFVGPLSVSDISALLQQAENICLLKQSRDIAN